MKIEKNAKVSIEYTLRNDDGDVLDNSQETEPLTFLQGTGQIIPGLEKAIEGKVEGEKFTVTIEPDEGYGTYDEELVVEVARSQFHDLKKIEKGSEVQAEMQDGSTQVFVVKSVTDEQVTLDANHPLAGSTLHFDVRVTGVSEATKEEIDHGHAH